VTTVAVHTIVLDESAHLERWAESAREADLLFVADTGSDDGTVQLAKDLGIEVERIWVEPWRFDTARNAGLALLPSDVDIVITLDADEILVPGWRQALDAAVAGRPDAQRWSYEYVWSWVAPGVPDVTFTADRCYSRAGWRWHGAVHEVLKPSSLMAPGLGHAVPAGFRIEHYSDHTKSRRNYLGLLELAVAEEPRNPRQRFYLAREYFFAGSWVEARNAFSGYLGMPEATWSAERAEAYRYLAKMDAEPERWLLRALAEDPARRDAAVDLVDFYEKHERWDEARGMAMRALRSRTRTGDYMTAARTWDDDRLHRVIEGRAGESV
jgi:glycosyltransferase involved in cell wall biosynthesis